MNCPYCAKEMETGYLRGGSGYELLWTEEPFKMTSLPTGNDFFVCKASDVYRPIAHLCRTCGKIVLDGDGAFESLVGFQLTLQRFWNRGSGVACAEKRLLPVRVLRLGKMLSSEDERSIRLMTAAVDESSNGRVVSLLRCQKGKDDGVGSLRKNRQRRIPCRRGRVAGENGPPRSFASAPS